MSGNSVTIVGNVTRDPELRFTPSGQANARLGVAVNRRWQDRNSGEWQEATSFFDVICWRDLAENVSDSIKKGTRVIVTGRLEQRSWEQEGNKRSAVEIIADEVAPSLRWATANVVKSERRSGGGDQGGGGGGSGYGRSAPPSEPPPYDDFGDEPF
jgi:single-strand DNA-binding protein